MVENGHPVFRNAVSLADCGRTVPGLTRWLIQASPLRPGRSEVRWGSVSGGGGEARSLLHSLARQTPFRFVRAGTESPERHQTSVHVNNLAVGVPRREC